MKAEDAITQVIIDIKEFKQNNKDVVAVDNLLKYLEAFKLETCDTSEFDRQKHERAMELNRALNVAQLAHYEAICTNRVDVRRSVMTTAAMALKSAILINGGAAIATLAFIGNILKETSKNINVPTLSYALNLFAYGTLAAVIATGFTYFSEACIDASLSDDNKKDYFYGGATKSSWAAVIFVVVSYIFFFSGIHKASDALSP